MSSSERTGLSRITDWFSAIPRAYEIASIALAIVAWELFVTSGVIPVRLIPRPSVVAVNTVALLGTGRFVGHVMVTLYRTVAASLLAVVPGIALGLMMGWNEQVKAAFYPILSGVYPLPKVALLPLLMLIVGIGDQAMVLTASLAAIFLILLNAMHGVEEVSEIYVDAAEDNGVETTVQYFREVLLPATLPRIFTGLRLTLSTALVVIISVEFIVAKEGLGYFIWVSWTTYVLPNMYAGLVITGIIGMVITYGLQSLGTYLIPWQEAVTG